MQTRNHRFFRLAEADIVPKALQWAARFGHCHFCTDNGLGGSYPNGGFPAMLAAGARQTVPLRKGMVFSDLQTFHDHHQDWLIGHLGYDLKNETENLDSGNPVSVHFPDAFFYVPQHLVWFREGGLEIATFGEPEQVFQAIAEMEIAAAGPTFTGHIQAALHARNTCKPLKNCANTSWTAMCMRSTIAWNFSPKRPD